MSSDSTQSEPAGQGGWGTPPWQPTPEPGQAIDQSPAANVSKPAAVPSVPPADTFRMFSDVKLDGVWQVPEHQKYRLLICDFDLDLRHAVLNGPVTTIEIHAIFADIKIIVPPSYRVELSASSVMADVGFKRPSRLRKGGDQVVPQAAPDAPLIRITGTAVLADLKVEYLEP